LAPRSATWLRSASAKTVHLESRLAIFRRTIAGGQQTFIVEHEAAGCDIYFTPNPIKRGLHKKASKDDIPEARWIWVDMDPRKGKPLEEERAAMLALLTTNLPAAIPRPNRVIDSGRGYWGFWKLETPQPVDGKDGQLTTTVESYGRGLEKAFGSYADNCHNIDRIGRLSGTRNSKTGAISRALHEYSHDTPYAIGRFPRASDQKKKPDAARATGLEVLGNYDPLTRDAPELANVDALQAPSAPPSSMRPRSDGRTSKEWLYPAGGVQPLGSPPMPQLWPWMRFWCDGWGKPVGSSYDHKSTRGTGHDGPTGPTPTAI
jgi:hypothetical protein